MNSSGIVPEGRPYNYATLSDPTREIRLVELLPGRLNDPIRLSISICAREQEPKANGGRMSLTEVRRSLPRGWGANITLTKEYFFRRTDRFEDEWQREHPDPSIHGSRYLLQGCDGEEVADADSQLRYEALSYNWGPDVITECAVIVEEGLPTFPQPYIPLRENLATALRHLRDPSQPRRLWVDALCINQQDEKEKGDQVRRMGLIMQQAYRVVGFIGAAQDQSTHALATLRYLGEQVEVFSYSFKVAAENAVELSWYRSDCDLSYDAETWTAVEDLLNRAWFSRLWIVQELLLANNRAVIQCGHETVPLFLFRRAVKCLQGKNWLPSARLRSLVNHVEGITGYNSTMPFSQLLNLGSSRYCADPRDRVYALLGLASPKFAAKIFPQYDIPVCEAFKKAFLTYTNHIKRLSLLRYCFRSTGRSEWPSWVPDFSATSPYDRRCSPQFASGYSRAHYLYRAPDVLEVVGVVAASISVVKRLVASPNDLHEVMSEIKSWQCCEEGRELYPTGDSTDVALAITLRMHHVMERYPKMLQKLTVAKWLEDLHRFGILGGIPLSTSTEAKSAYGRIAQVVRGRAFISTDRGYLGLAPLDARPGNAIFLSAYFAGDVAETFLGDVICTLLGCDCPMLLREQDDSFFAVIGECFVYGLGDANSLLGPLPEPWKVTEHRVGGQRTQYRFCNPRTGTKTAGDPRVDPHPDWERARQDRGADAAEFYDYFRNKKTDEVMDSDPLLLPEALRERGLDVRTFCLK